MISTVRLSGNGGAGFGSFGQGFECFVELPAQMRPTAPMRNILHIIVAVIVIRLEIAVKVGQERSRIPSAVPRLVFIERDLPLLCRSGHVQPHITLYNGLRNPLYQ